MIKGRTRYRSAYRVMLKGGNDGRSVFTCIICYYCQVDLIKGIFVGSVKHDIWKYVINVLNYNMIPEPDVNRSNYLSALDRGVLILAYLNFTIVI